MAVYYTGGNNGGGLFGALARAATMAIPGAQAVAPYVMGASALANGDVGGAIGNVLGGAQQQGAAGAAPQANESFTDALMNAHRRNFAPAYNTDPVTGMRQTYKNPREVR